MSHRRELSVGHCMTALFSDGALAGLSDAELLDRFARRRPAGAVPSLDAELAFNALVVRHGPMVLGMCRRGLTDSRDVEDAFQATFLILARKAATVLVEDSLGRWLSGVTRRVVSRVRAGREIRRRFEGGIERWGAVPDPADEASGRELRDEIHAELARLPHRYKAAITLCLVEGRSHDEAAMRLRRPVGTVSSDVSRGCALLRVRLARRGIAPSASLLAPMLSASGSEAVAASLARSTVRSAIAFTSHEPACLAVPPRALELARGVRDMTLTAGMKRAGSMLLLCLASIGGGFASGQQDAGRVDPTKIARESEPEKELIRTHQEWGAATLRGDRDAVDRILHDDMVGTSSSDMGPFWNKALLLGRISAGAHSVGSRFELSEERVRLFGDAGVLTGRERVHPGGAEPPPSRSSRFTATYIRHQNRWRCVAYQSLEVDDSPQLAPKPNVSR